MGISFEKPQEDTEWRTDILYFWPHMGHMEIPRPRTEFELLRSFNSLLRARDWTLTSAVTQAAAVRFLSDHTTVGTPYVSHF